MRVLLDGLYRAAAWLAALAMIGVLVMVLSSVVSRQFGVFVPGTDAYAGYLMAAAGFLALAYALRRRDHIRVTLVLNALVPRRRHRLELVTLGLAALLGLNFAWFSIRLVMQSLEFNDISTGNDATPLWIPQMAMAVGTVIFAIALVDDWIGEWRGTRAAPTDEVQRIE
jgi:TRAP-type C4-dicarboxylate transport system permease small subunit